jgi:hypothetical protein
MVRVCAVDIDRFRKELARLIGESILTSIRYELTLNAVGNRRQNRNFGFARGQQVVQFHNTILSLLLRVFLGFVPEGVLLFERKVADLDAAFFADGFHIIEPLVELLIGFP